MSIFFIVFQKSQKIAKQKILKLLRIKKKKRKTKKTEERKNYCPKKIFVEKNPKKIDQFDVFLGEIVGWIKIFSYFFNFYFLF